MTISGAIKIDNGLPIGRGHAVYEIYSHSNGRFYIKSTSGLEFMPSNHNGFTFNQALKQVKFWVKDDHSNYQL